MSLITRLTLMNEAHAKALLLIQVDGMSLLDAVATAAYEFKLSGPQQEILECSQILNEAHPCSGVISYRKRRGRKIHFIMSGLTFTAARNYIAWERVERNTTGETLYQYLWTSNGITRELTQS